MTATGSAGGVYEALTFDCYGTLIDWRAGLLAALRASPALRDCSLDAARFLADRGAEENALESGPWRPYRDIVAASTMAALARQDLALSRPEADTVAASVGDWRPFPDTRTALEALGRGRRLAIVSNVDRRDIEGSLEHMGVTFAVVITAEDVRSYKPARAHFDAVLRRLDVPRKRVLHVAQSLYHDIRPATALGVDAAWINREDEALPPDLAPRFVEENLSSLARRLGPGLLSG